MAMMLAKRTSLAKAYVGLFQKTSKILVRTAVRLASQKMMLIKAWREKTNHLAKSITLNALKLVMVRSQAIKLAGRHNKERNVFQSIRDAENKWRLLADKAQTLHRRFLVKSAIQRAALARKNTEVMEQQIIQNSALIMQGYTFKMFFNIAKLSNAHRSALIRWAFKSWVGHSAARKQSFQEQE